MKKVFIFVLVLFTAIPSFACTSVIISGKMSASGRPVMYKHRDTGQLDNYIGWYKGEKNSFIGLVNSICNGGEVWTGTNSSGFSIMNTATYDLKDDKVPESEMDREGIVMYRALEICSTLKDFENLLDTLKRPMGVEANFGVIDAFGGAAYYEVNNHKWIKYDVNDPNIAPKGYLVVTNFTQSGRPQDRKGVDRYELAYGIMSSLDGQEEKDIFCDHTFLLNNISRKGAPILRNITSATIAIEGVAAGSDPSKTVMWTTCGYPTAAICVPLMVLDDNYLPSYLTAGENNHSQMCNKAMEIKKTGKNILGIILPIEKNIDDCFNKIYTNWKEGIISDSEFKSCYKDLTVKIFENFTGKLANFY